MGSCLDSIQGHNTSCIVCEDAALDMTASRTQSSFSEGREMTQYLEVFTM